MLRQSRDWLNLHRMQAWKQLGKEDMDPIEEKDITNTQQYTSPFQSLAMDSLNIITQIKSQEQNKTDTERKEDDNVHYLPIYCHVCAPHKEESTDPHLTLQ